MSSKAKIASVVGAIGMMLVAPAAVARPLDEVVASKVLNVVAYDDNKPFSWSQDGKPTGIDVEIGHAIAKRLGVEASIILRMPGEKVDDDLRANVWRGPLTGGGVGDVMLHVPIDRELALRNKEVVIGNAYFNEEVALAIHPDLTGDKPTYDVFKRMKVGVQLATVADYFLMRFDNGALVPNVDHHIRPEQGVSRFLKRETAALMGVRAYVESMLRDAGHTATWVTPPTPGMVRTGWLVGTAVKENSRDLHYAVAQALSDLRASGELAAICARFGVTYVPPPDP